MSAFESVKSMALIDTILEGNNLDTLKNLPDNSIDCCITSPPYYLQRHYSNSEVEIGRENTPEEYVSRICDVFDEVKRVLKNEGTLWLNLGDTYAGSVKGGANTGDGKQGYLKGAVDSKFFESKQYPAKALLGIPWKVAFAMNDRGWILRDDIVWNKPCPMPEPCKDRFVRAHEYVFLFVKQPNYYFDHYAALEPATGYDGRKDTALKIANFCKTVYGDKRKQRERWAQRFSVTLNDEQNLFDDDLQIDDLPVKPHTFGINNPDRRDTCRFCVDMPYRTRRDVWTIVTEPSTEGHYAMYPQKLVLQCLLCGCPENGIVLDPFLGSGTTAIVAKKNNRHYIGCELNHDYVQMAKRRLGEVSPLFDGACTNHQNF